MNLIPVISCLYLKHFEKSLGYLCYKGKIWCYQGFLERMSEPVTAMFTWSNNIYTNGDGHVFTLQACSLKYYLVSWAYLLCIVL